MRGAYTTTQNLLISQPQLSAAHFMSSGRDSLCNCPLPPSAMPGAAMSSKLKSSLPTCNACAAIEAEPGVGKQAFAQLLYSRSPFERTKQNRSEAREWLPSEVDPQSLTGLTYLDRVELLAPPGQARLLCVLKSLQQDRPVGAFALVASSERSLHSTRCHFPQLHPKEPSR